MLWSWTIPYTEIISVPLQYKLLYVKYCKLQGATLVFFQKRVKEEKWLWLVAATVTKWTGLNRGDRGALALHSQLPLSQTHCQQHSSKPPKPTLPKSPSWDATHIHCSPDLGSSQQLGSVDGMFLLLKCYLAKVCGCCLMSVTLWISKTLTRLTLAGCYTSFFIRSLMFWCFVSLSWRHKILDNTNFRRFKPLVIESCQLIVFIICN